MFRSIILLLLFSSSVLAAKVTPQCGSRTWEELEVKYCTAAPQNGTSDSLIVYFHGLGGDEKEWFENPALISIHKEIVKKGLDPWIITVSYGPAWLLTEVDSSYKLFAKTMDEILPDLQKKFHPTAFHERFMIGASMGGFNASQVLLKRPESYERFMLICPAITTVGPESTDQEVADYIRRTGADPEKVSFMVDWGKLEFPTATDWENHSPLILADKVKALPRVYLSCGLKDDYGFQEGALSLYQKIKTKAKTSWWYPIPNGKHCSFDRASIIKFLVER
jgi:pimeloyl-ACP methyl ester carboxylesterase